MKTGIDQMIRSVFEHDLTLTIRYKATDQQLQYTKTKIYVQLTKERFSSSCSDLFFILHALSAYDEFI